MGDATNDTSGLIVLSSDTITQQPRDLVVYIIAFLLNTNGSGQ